MIWTLLALLTQIVLGGFIAYYGDLQGRRWGKKRVSWLGLRPKHTAILITSLTGAVIALLSVVGMMLIVPTVREVVLKGERAIRENKQLNARYTQQRKLYDLTLADKQAQITLKTKQETELNALLGNTRTQLKNATDYNDEISAKNKTLECDQTRLTQDVALLKTAREKLLAQKQQLTRANQQLAVENRHSEEINQDLGRQNLAAIRDNDILTKTNGELRTKNQELSGENSTLAQANADLKIKNNQLTTKNQELARRSDDLQAIKVAYERQNSDLTKNYTDLNERMTGLLANSERSYTQSYLTLRQGRIALRAGEMIGRRVINLDAQPSVERLRQELELMLEDASTAALVRGAARGDNGRAVRIVPKRVVFEDSDQSADERASLTALAENLAERAAKSDVPIVVAVKVVYNSLENEQALVELSAQTVGKAFDKGAVVAEQRIDARQPIEKVLEDIVTFLEKDVRRAAAQAGVVPQIDPDTGTQKYGSVGPRDLLLLTDRARRMGGIVLIRAVTKDTLSNADPLQVQFQVLRARGDLEKFPVPTNALHER